MKRSVIAAFLLCSMGIQAQNVKLPWTQEFTNEQSLDRFTVIDANVDIIFYKPANYLEKSIKQWYYFSIINYRLSINRSITTVLSSFKRLMFCLGTQ